MSIFKNPNLIATLRCYSKQTATMSDVWEIIDIIEEHKEEIATALELLPQLVEWKHYTSGLGYEDPIMWQEASDLVYPEVTPVLP